MLGHRNRAVIERLEASPKPPDALATVTAGHAKATDPECNDSPVQGVRPADERVRSDIFPPHRLTPVATRRGRARRLQNRLHTPSTPDKVPSSAAWNLPCRRQPDGAHDHTARHAGACPKPPERVSDLCPGTSRNAPSGGSGRLRQRVYQARNPRDQRVLSSCGNPATSRLW